MFKRLRWLVLGYILGVFTFDIVKRQLDTKYSDNKVYSTFIETLNSVTDFNKNKKNVEVYIEEN